MTALRPEPFTRDDVQLGVQSLLANRYDRELDVEDLDEVVRLVLTSATKRVREAAYRAGREDAARDILADLDRVRGRVDERVGDPKLAAVQKAAMHMASLRVALLLDRWSAGNQPRTIQEGEVQDTSRGTEEDG